MLETILWFCDLFKLEEENWVFLRISFPQIILAEDLIARCFLVFNLFLTDFISGMVTSTNELP